MMYASSELYRALLMLSLTTTALSTEPEVRMLSEESRERIYTKIAQQSRYVPISDWTLLGLVFRGIITYTDLRLGRINYRDVLYLNDALAIRDDIEAFELASTQAESEAKKLQ